MPLAIDPVTISTLVALVATATGLSVWLGRLGQRVDRLEADVTELKHGQQEILKLLHQHTGYHQGLDASADRPA
ncbi:MAG: hypothetical protein F4W95_15355 [Chloroflexi bacterium]|nr:hypothetical protein [Chloroflexota bacterium]MYD49834.1 hypothetical protein [Chloroflexota bacterium]